MRYASDLTRKQWNKIKHFFKNEERGKQLLRNTRRLKVFEVMTLTVKVSRKQSKNWG